MSRREITIGINASMLDDKPTGVGVYSFNLINNLSNLPLTGKWKKIKVFTPTRSMLDKRIQIVKLSQLLLSSKYGKVAALCRFIWNTFYYPFQARKLDLLISPTTHGSFLLKDQIITIHDLLSLRYTNINIHQRFYYKYLLPSLIKRAKLIIAVSENTKKDIIHYFNCPEDKISVIYNGYDDTRYFPLPENLGIIYHEYSVKNYFLAVGPTYPHKNFEMLILVYSELETSLREKHPLVIVGGKPKYVSVLKKLAEHLGMQEHIHFLGYVPIQLMPSLYREALSLVFPSIYEGFGIPLLEAMASGCPVIVSHTSSMPEVCGEAALYFNPHDKYSLADLLKRIIAEPEIRTELIIKGIRQAKKFSWKQMAESFSEIINITLNNDNKN